MQVDVVEFKNEENTIWVQAIFRWEQDKRIEDRGTEREFVEGWERIKRDEIKERGVRRRKEQGGEWK